METKIALKRIKKERQELEKYDSNIIKIIGFDDNPYEFHFTIKGLDESVFENGYYHGCISLPDKYPFKAPDIIFYTKNGKFQQNQKICLNYTSYHNESWSPNVKMVNLIETIRIFMIENNSGIGIIKDSDTNIKNYAKESVNYNCPKCGSIKEIIEKYLI